MAILVDSKDLRPYLNELVGELEIAMVDPVPATRSTAARALGSLVEKLGEDSFPGLIGKLVATLRMTPKLVIGLVSTSIGRSYLWTWDQQVGRDVAAYFVVGRCSTYACWVYAIVIVFTRMFWVTVFSIS